MFKNQWTYDRIIKAGARQFTYYEIVYNSLPSCKPVSSDKYDDCMDEKCNFAYEQTIKKFPELKFKTEIIRGQDGTTNYRYY